MAPESVTPPELSGGVLLNQPSTPPSIDDLTIVDLLGLAFTKTEVYSDLTESGAAKRELALAKTHIEGAVMRVNRGLALIAGVFSVADIEADTGLKIVTNETEGGE